MEYDKLLRSAHKMRKIMDKKNREKAAEDIGERFKKLKIMGI
jgi:hypothetical protein